MLLTNNPAIQEVLFFPQMKPEKIEASVTLDLSFPDANVPQEWVTHLFSLGYVNKEKVLEGGIGKVANELNGLRKKKKLDLKGVSPEEVKQWFS
jgi:lysyl-tRNA synthetase class 2